MPRKHIDFVPKLPAHPAEEPALHKPIVSVHASRQPGPGRTAIVICAVIIVTAFMYVWFV